MAAPRAPSRRIDPSAATVTSTNSLPADDVSRARQQGGALAPPCTSACGGSVGWGQSRRGVARSVARADFARVGVAVRVVARPVVVLMGDGLLDAALGYARRGWAVLPCHAPNELGRCSCGY